MKVPHQLSGSWGFHKPQINSRAFFSIFVFLDSSALSDTLNDSLNTLHLEYYFLTSWLYLFLSVSMLFTAPLKFLLPCFWVMPTFPHFLFSFKVFSINISSNLVSTTFIWLACMFSQNIHFWVFLYIVPNRIAKSIIASTSTCIIPGLYW